MSHSQKLLDQVIDNPFDTVARRVYADLLMEQGDPRGDFIRLQCDLEELDPFDLKHEQVAAEESKLLKKHRAAWSKELKKLATAVEFRRGFAEHVSVKAEVCSKHLPKLMAMAPVRSLKLCGDRESLGKVAGCKELDQIEELSVSSMRLGGKFGAALFKSDHLGAVTSLDASHNGLGEQGLESILNCRSLKQVQSLNIDDNRLGEPGLELLANSKMLGKLKHLSLNSSRVTHDAFLYLVESGRLKNLESLEFERTAVRDGLVELAQVEEFRPKRLHMNIAGISTKGIKAMVDNGTLERIEYLSCYWGKIKDAGAKALAAADMPRLKVLKLGNNEIKDAGGQALLSAPWMNGVRELDLINNDLGLKTMKALAASPAMETLVRVRFAGPGITEKVAAAVAKTDFESSIREIRFSLKESDLTQTLIDSGKFPYLVR